MYQMPPELYNKFKQHLYDAQDLFDKGGSFATKMMENIGNGLPLRISIDMICERASNCDSTALGIKNASEFFKQPIAQEAVDFASAAKEFYSAAAILIQFRMTMKYDFAT